MSCSTDRNNAIQLEVNINQQYSMINGRENSSQNGSHPTSRRPSRNSIHNDHKGSEKFIPIHFNVSPLKLFNEYLIQENLFKYILFYKAIEELRAADYKNFEEILNKYSSHSDDPAKIADLVGCIDINLIRETKHSHKVIDLIDLQLQVLQEKVYEILSDAWETFQDKFMADTIDLTPTIKSTKRKSRIVCTYVTANSKTFKLF
jgi:hypothetical protein